MNRKCLLSFQAPRGSLRNGHYCSLPLSLRHAHDLMPSCLHFHLVASFSGVRIDFSYLSQLPSQGHSCLPDSRGLFRLVTLPPHSFRSLPFSASQNSQATLLFIFQIQTSPKMVRFLDPLITTHTVLHKAYDLWPLRSERLMMWQAHGVSGLHSNPEFQTQLKQT